MKRRLLPLVLLVPLAACTLNRPKAEHELPSASTYSYRAAVTALPANAKTVSLTVRVPLECAAGELQRLTAYGLVGNAPFEVEVPDEPEGELVRGNTTVRWARLFEVDAGPRWREVAVQTAGQPIELGLRIALAAPAAATDEAVAALEAELRARTSLDLDSGPSEAVALRFERQK